MPIALRLPLLLSHGLGESLFREAVVLGDAGGEAAVGGHHVIDFATAQAGQRPCVKASEREALSDAWAVRGLVREVA